MKVLYIDCFGGFDTNMLLGALIDMGASPIYTEQELISKGIEADIVSDRVRRSGIDAVFAYTRCVRNENSEDKKIKNMCDALGECDNDNICLWSAVLCCIECFGVEKIICSPIADGSGINHSGMPVPSVDVMELLKKYHIPIKTVDVGRELVSCEGAVFLGENVDEFGMLPVGNIMCIGYGAGEENVDGCVNIVRCVLTETQDCDIFEKEIEMLFDI